MLCNRPTDLGGGGGGGSWKRGTEGREKQRKNGGISRRGEVSPMPRVFFSSFSLYILPQALFLDSDY